MAHLRSSFATQRKQPILVAWIYTYLWRFSHNLWIISFVHFFSSQSSNSLDLDSFYLRPLPIVAYICCAPIPVLRSVNRSLGGATYTTQLKILGRQVLFSAQFCAIQQLFYCWLLLVLPTAIYYYCCCWFVTYYCWLLLLRLLDPICWFLCTAAVIICSSVSFWVLFVVHFYSVPSGNCSWLLVAVCCNTSWLCSYNLDCGVIRLWLDCNSTAAQLSTLSSVRVLLTRL